LFQAKNAFSALIFEDPNQTNLINDYISSGVPALILTETIVDDADSNVLFLAN
jgi:hypothetical protein